MLREEAFFSKKEIVPQNQIVPPNHPNLVGSVNFDPFVLFMAISWQLDTTQDFQGFCWTSHAQIIKHDDNDGSRDDGAPLVMMMVMMVVMMVVVKITFITIIINISLKDCLHTLMTSNYLFCQKSLFQPISKFSKEVGNAIHGTGENDGNKEWVSSPQNSNVLMRSQTDLSLKWPSCHLAKPFTSIVINATECYPIVEKKSEWR